MVITPKDEFAVDEELIADELCTDELVTDDCRLELEDSELFSEDDNELATDDVALDDEATLFELELTAELTAALLLVEVVLPPPPPQAANTVVSSVIHTILCSFIINLLIDYYLAVLWLSLFDVLARFRRFIRHLKITSVANMCCEVVYCRCTRRC